MLYSGAQKQRRPTNGPIGYITPTAEGGSERCKAEDRIRSRPQVGGMAV